jgi:hypothetical protein
LVGLSWSNSSPLFAMKCITSGDKTSTKVIHHLCGGIVFLEYDIMYMYGYGPCMYHQGLILGIIKYICCWLYSGFYKPWAQVAKLIARLYHLLCPNSLMFFMTAPS